MVQNGGLGPKIVQRGKTDHLEHLSSLGPEVVQIAPKKAIRSMWAALGPKLSKIAAKLTIWSMWAALGPK